MTALNPYDLEGFRAARDSILYEIEEMAGLLVQLHHLRSKLDHDHDLIVGEIHAAFNRVRRRLDQTRDAMATRIHQIEART